MCHDDVTGNTWNVGIDIGMIGRWNGRQDIEAKRLDNIDLSTLDAPTLLGHAKFMDGMKIL